MDVESSDGETTTFDGVSRVGGAREAGFVETRGAEDRFGRGRDAWDGQWPRRRRDGDERREPSRR